MEHQALACAFTIRPDSSNIGIRRTKNIIHDDLISSAFKHRAKWNIQACCWCWLVCWREADWTMKNDKETAHICESFKQFRWFLQGISRNIEKGNGHLGDYSNCKRLSFAMCNSNLCYMAKCIFAFKVAELLTFNACGQKLHRGCHEASTVTYCTGIVADPLPKALPEPLQNYVPSKHHSIIAVRIHIIHSECRWLTREQGGTYFCAQTKTGTQFSKVPLIQEVAFLIREALDGTQHGKTILLCAIANEKNRMSIATQFAMVTPRRLQEKAKGAWAFALRFSLSCSIP